MWWLIDRVLIDPHLAGELNRWRAELGLAPVARPFRTWIAWGWPVTFARAASRGSASPGSWVPFRATPAVAAACRRWAAEVRASRPLEASCEILEKLAPTPKGVARRN